MKIGIVGWGIEGKSVFKYFGPDNEYLIVNEHPRDDFPQETDKVTVRFLNTTRPAGVTSNVTDLSYLEGIEDCDKIVYTPTAHRKLKEVFGKNDELWGKTTSAMHIFFETVKTKNIIGITGTKGKGTTSTMVFQMLEAAGLKTYLGGNIGYSVLDFVKEVQSDDWVVLELSSFQLSFFPYSPHVAVCLMIVSDHLDWHPDIEDYLEAKRNIFAYQTTDDIAVYLDKNERSKGLAQSSAGQKIPFYSSPGARVRKDGKIVISEPEIEIIDKSKVQLLGEHNLQNVCAAITAFWFGIKNINDQDKIKAIREVLTTFSGLEHRLEFVREVNGIKYYNDSFGTSPDTSIVAMKTFEQPKIMILGGSDKGQSFDNLVDEVLENNVRHVIAIGKTGTKIANLLRQHGFTSISEGVKTTQEIIDIAQKVAQSGDVVLLSAADASFDMFTDYKDRGNQFKKAVLKLS